MNKWIILVFLAVLTTKVILACDDLCRYESLCQPNESNMFQSYGYMSCLCTVCYFPEIRPIFRVKVQIFEKVSSPKQIL
jgi:hypothetical protein